MPARLSNRVSKIWKKSFAFQMLFEIRTIWEWNNYVNVRNQNVRISDIYCTYYIFVLQVRHCLSEILSACLQYCRLVENETEEKLEILSALSINFSRQSSLLFELLTSIRSRQTGSQLAQLLLRIDYNRYFSNHGHNIGTFAWKKLVQQISKKYHCAKQTKKV